METSFFNTAKMVLNKGLLVISTLLCLLGASILATCPPSLYTDWQGTIQSPGFNTTGRYGANMTCVYNIRVSAYRRIILEFKSLSILGSMPECAEDSVEIFVGCSNTSIGKFCSCSNLSIPDKIHSYDHCMTLVFKSDGSNQGKGFEAQYTTANNTAARLDTKNCSTNSVTPSHGTIYTPNWPLEYPESASCVWTFNPPPKTIVRFFFTSFELDGDPFCDPNRAPENGDQISIYGTNITGVQLPIEKRICTMPADAFFAIKDMQTIEVRFGSNNDRSFDGTGVMAGYATYIKGEVNPSASGCKVLAPQSELPDCHEPEDCPSLVDFTGGGEALRKYCIQWKNDKAVKECKKTCGFPCSKPPSPPIEPVTAEPRIKKPTEKPTQPAGENLSGAN